MAKKSKNSAKKTQIPVWLLVAAALVILAVVVVAALQPPAAQQAPSAAQEAGALVVEGLPKEVTVSQAAKLRDEGAFILDVREPSEWQEAHVPDSTLIPLGQLAERINEVPKDRQVVVICRSGNRSAQGRDVLLSAGYENVTSVAGGITDWRTSGFPTVSGP